MQYRLKRYITYCCITLIACILPFIQINQNQIFLLSFDHKELHLLGLVFSMQELYVMPFLLIILFVGIFFITTLLGRFWCGWACPQTIFRVILRDLIEGKILKLNKISNKQKTQDLSTWSAKLKKLISFLIITVLCFCASAVLLFYFVPPSDFFTYLLDPKDHLVLLGFWIGIGAFFTFDIFFLKENFCIYVCPYSRVQSVLFDEDTQSVIYDERRGGALFDSHKERIPLPLKQRIPEAECIECQKCVKVCPTHIDIRAGMQLECINCLECVDACTSVMGKFQKPSLVQWSSPNAIRQNSKIKYWRTKTIGYSFVLTLSIFLAFFMGEKHDQILLNITRPTSLYTIHTDQSITNEYILLIENLNQKNQDFIISISHPDLEITRPKHKILIKGGQKRRTVLILKYKGKLQNPARDLSIPITIKISSTQNPSITTQRRTVFIYPKEQP
ncbi:cytochrome c oxidase accessory protein CcoG [Helicobacter pametensis]|uniref:cytochrome c oxidase accessory protein CcoG n=1 Tax=Helicobacter pametensis TaxID=95149 RepID=UPI00048134FA|nr:cytochrome c oxidase accessory protein CcoG [Helicobacter pametensis]